LIIEFSNQECPEKLSQEANKKGTNKSIMKWALPPAAIPVAAARASKRPTARNGAFGKESISSVTLPAWYRRYKIEKYTSTYLKSTIYSKIQLSPW
jgi:hypothetical protein